MPVKKHFKKDGGFVTETKSAFDNKNLIGFFALLYKVDKRVNPKLYLGQSFVTGASASFPENKPAV